MNDLLQQEHSVSFLINFITNSCFFCSIKLRFELLWFQNPFDLFYNSLIRKKETSLFTLIIKIILHVSFSFFLALIWSFVLLKYERLLCFLSVNYQDSYLCSHDLGYSNWKQKTTNMIDGSLGHHSHCSLLFISLICELL